VDVKAMQAKIGQLALENGPEALKVHRFIDQLLD
jgi:hypothetical protein